MQREPYTGTFDVFVDGKKQDILLANGVSRAFVIGPPGEHSVVIAYDTSAIFLGEAVSAFTLLLIILYVFFDFNPFRKLKNLKIGIKVVSETQPQKAQESSK